MGALAVIQGLKDKGFRITPIRQQIIEILSKSHNPLTSSDVLTILHKTNEKINKTTVYREISFLLKQELLEEIDLGEGKKRYDLIKNKAHHHHMTCNNCGAIKYLPLQDNVFLQSIEKNTKFKIQKHSFEVFGICSSCQ